MKIYFNNISDFICCKKSQGLSTQGVFLAVFVCFCMFSF